MKNAIKQKKADAREQRFLENLALGLPVNQSAIKAGYSKSYANGTVYQKLTNPTFQAKMQAFVESLPEYRRNLAKLRMAQAYKIEQKIYDKAATDVEFATRPIVNKTLERDYKIAGLLQDASPTQILIPVQVAIQVQGAMEEQQVKAIPAPEQDDSD